MRYYQYSRKEIKPFIPPKYNRVLEVGCGEGKFKTHLTLPHIYWGIEQSEKAASTASKELDQIFNMSFDNAYDQLPDHHFDLVICNDVIVQMPFYRKFSEKCRLILV